MAMAALPSIRTGLVFLATISVGLMAGTFALYAHTIMPGLGKTDDRTFVAAFQAIDRAIINPWFIGLTFGAALVLTLASTIAYLGHDAFRWVLAAFLGYAIAVLVTLFVHVPLNNAIKAASDAASSADLSEIRRQFHESRWVTWNLVRVIASLGSFVSLLWARR
jgi:uncharacterized membrane protein